MAGGILGISVSALNAAQVGMATTEHNISNANTPGFNRQEVQLSARQAQFTGAGFVGQGVDASSVKRVYNEFLNKQVLQEQGLSSQLNTYYTQIKQIDNLVADPVAGLSPALQSFFGAVNNVANSPESTAARQSMVTSANALSSTFQSMNQRMVDLNDSVNGQIGYSVTQVNSYAKQIASLNQRIVIAQSANGPLPNDLMDQRDQLVTQLNKEIKATTVQQGDGSFSVFIGNGQPMVVGNQAYSMTTQRSATDPTKMDVAYMFSGGKTAVMQQSALQGGNLGGLIAFRDEALTDSQNALGRVAMGIAGIFNQQHQLGQDLNGALGGKFFVQPVPQVTGNNNNALPSAVVTASVNSSAGYTALTGSDYSLAFDGTNYNLTRLSDKTITTYAPAAFPITVDGLTIGVSAVPAPTAGDSFLIRPTVNAAHDIAAAISDPAKIAAAAPVRTNAPLANQGTGTISAGAVSVGYTAATVTPAVTLTYNSGPNTLTGFPAALPVTVTNNGVATVFAAGAAVTYTDGATISFGGVSFTLKGTPTNGDTFTVASNTGATTDSRNALLLAGLQTQNSMAGGTTSFQGAYSQFVSYVGNKTRELEVTSTAQASMVEQSVQAQQSFSGVNLDEEAANLLRYQRAYQAAGKALQIANTMFDSILNI